MANSREPITLWPLFEDRAFCVQSSSASSTWHLIELFSASLFGAGNLDHFECAKIPHVQSLRLGAVIARVCQAALFLPTPAPPRPTPAAPLCCNEADRPIHSRRSHRKRPPRAFLRDKIPVPSRRWDWSTLAERPPPVAGTAADHSDRPLQRGQTAPVPLFVQPHLRRGPARTRAWRVAP
jgi:hypothetical protein